MTNLLVLAISCAAALGLAEAGVRTFVPQHMWATQTESGLIVNRSSGSALHRFADRSVRYAFTSPHLRDSRPDTGAIQVLALGDSFTFGWLLDDDATYVRRLHRFSDAEFGDRVFNYLNAAVGGWGAADYVRYVEEFGDTVDPDVMLVFLNADDIGRSVGSGLYAWSEETGLEARTLSISGTRRLAHALPGYAWAAEHSHLLRLVRNRAALLVAAGGASAPTDPARVVRAPRSETVNASQTHAVAMGQALFRRLKRWCDARDVSLLVATTGFHRLKSSEAGPEEPTVAFMAVAPAFFEEEGIPFHDPSAVVSAAVASAPEVYLIPKDGHPSEAGSRLIAEQTWPFLRAHLRACLPQPAACAP